MDEGPLAARFAAWRDRRSCGTCTACCYVFAVADAPTRAYDWCMHCTPGVGCDVYATRPVDCRTFHCAWRVGFGTDDDRPDRQGTVLDLEADGDAMVVRVWRPRQLQKRKLLSAARMLGEITTALRQDGYTVRAETHGPPKE